MATPAIQTLLTDAQQVLNLNSVSEIRATMAAALANANVGTPLSPSLTTQQLWDEFYQIVRQPETDIESIITNQLMKFLYAPPAPGGVGADKQVIFNDGGTLAGDADFIWNKTTNLLTVTGSATITGDLTVRTNKLAVTSTGVGINTASPGYALDISGNARITNNVYVPSSTTYKVGPVAGTWAGMRFDSNNQMFLDSDTAIQLRVNGGTSFLTAATLDSSGNLGLGVTPSAWLSDFKTLQVSTYTSFYGRVGTNEGGIIKNVYRDTGGAFKFLQNGYGSSYALQSDGSHAFYNWGNNVSGAGAAASPTQAMTLDASGNLLVGLTSGAKFSVRYNGYDTHFGLGANYDNYITAGPSGVTIFRNDTSERARLDASGRLIVGTTAIGPFDTKLTLSYDAGTTKWSVGPWSGGGVNFVIAATSSSGGVYLAGTAATSWSAVSDERFKNIIEPITNAVSKVSSLRSVIGTLKGDKSNTRKAFLIAQDVQAVLPEAVDSNNPDKLGLAYSEVIPLLVAAIKELTARVIALENK